MPTASFLERRAAGRPTHLQAPIMTNPFSLAIIGFPGPLEVVRFRGVEEVNTTYRFYVDFLVDHAVEPDDVLDKTVCLTIAGETPRYVHGVVTSCELRRRPANGHSAVRIRIEPRLAT